MTTLDHMSFDSADHPAGERVARYAAFNGSATRIDTCGADFAMRVARWRLHRTILHERHGNDVTHERDAAAIGDGLTHLMLHLVVSGDYAIDSGEGFRTVDPGAIVMLDMQAPTRSRARHGHVITVSIARDVALAALGSLACIHGRMVSGPAVYPVADLLISLCRRAAVIPASTSASIAQAIMSLLAAALNDPPAVDVLPTREGVLFEPVRRLIDSRLSDPDLGPEMIMAMLDLSRSALYRLFQPWGGLMAFVHNRRLETARRLLADPHEERSTGDIAAALGFASAGGLVRRFATAYGMKPGAYREAMRSSHMVPGPDPRLDLWFSELR